MNMNRNSGVINDGAMKIHAKIYVHKTKNVFIVICEWKHSGHFAMTVYQ